MPFRALILAVLLLASAAGAQQPYPLANDELLRSARVWEARDRGDMARLALEKLVAARPDSPDALLELGELQLRMADVQAAQRVLEQLNRRFKDSPITRTFATELRVASRDRLQLASVQRLVQLGQGRQAREALQKLFPDGAPDGMYGIDYYRLLASTPGGWERARDGLRQLVVRRPDDPRYRLALARHLMGRETSELEGLRMLHDLSQRDDVRLRDIDSELSPAIVELGYRKVPAQILAAYSARRPDDAVAARLLRQRNQIEQEQQLILREADAALDPAQQRAHLQQIIDALLATEDAIANFDTALASLRALRSGVGNSSRLAPASRAAIEWARRSVASAKTDSARATIEKDVAIAFAREDFEQSIALAERLDALGAAEDADALLRAASTLAPGSTWLFETQVRRLLGRGEWKLAIERLQQRPLSDRWTASARNELLSNAFDRRADAAIASGDLDQGRDDLQQAIDLVPTYPWTRYRLAGLLAQDGNVERARDLMSEGVAAAPSNMEMRYAQALLLASIDEYAAALSAVDSIPPSSRTENMRDLHGRMRVAVARSTAQSRSQAGDILAARAALKDVEPLALDNLDRAVELTNAWFDLGEPAQAVRLMELHQSRTSPPTPDSLLAWATTLERAQDPRAAEALAQLRARTDLDPEQRVRIAALERTFELRSVRELQREGRLDAALARLDALLAITPDDRELRIARADLELSAGQFEQARDAYAALVGEEPQDVATRLDYVRALTETSAFDLALLQLQGAIEQAPPTDVELQLSIARRQLALGRAREASQTLENVLTRAPDRADALMLAGRARLAERDYAGARSYFGRAERTPDPTSVTEARVAREDIEQRRRHWMEAAFETRHKPGDSGVSQFDAHLVPSLWSYGYDYERRLTLRADVVSVDAGALSNDFDIAALLGTVQAAGSTASRRFVNDAQEGLALGLIYTTEHFIADVGTTPLGFRLPNVVGGIEWTTQWDDIDISLGLERRAVTSSVLSYAGMHDPITGREWGGVVETGPYVGAGLYRERFSVAGSARYTQIDGENVRDNTFMGVRLAADVRIFATGSLRAYVGGAVNYWSYEHNLQNYTFGHGGYYSPDAYTSISVPIELQGAWREWSYRVRASLTYSDSRIANAPFYPTDTALQAAATTAALPSGFDAPIYTDAGGSGTSVSGYASVERQLTRHWVIGAKLDIDRADYYEPTIAMLYVRHVFGDSPTTIEIPPRPLQPFIR